MKEKVKQKNGAIGVFDSGVGGLTVLKAIIKTLPQEDTIYLGDTARVPYGIRSPQTVLRYSLENTQFLVKKSIKVLVVACNTTSAISLPHLQKDFSLPVIGVIEPGAKKAALATKNNKIGVIGTEATVKSGAYLKAITRFAPQSKIFGQACPLFVPLVEEGWIDNEVALLSAERYLALLKKKEVDTVVLGCTHYPLLKKVIKKVMGNGVTLIDSAEETAKEVRRVLQEKGWLKEGPKEGRHQFFVTDDPDRFVRVGSKIIGKEIREVREVILK